MTPPGTRPPPTERRSGGSHRRCKWRSRGVALTWLHKLLARPSSCNPASPGADQVHGVADPSLKSETQSGEDGRMQQHLANHARDSINAREQRGKCEYARPQPDTRKVVRHPRCVSDLLDARMGDGDWGQITGSGDYTCIHYFDRVLITQATRPLPLVRR